MKNLNPVKNIPSLTFKTFAFNFFFQDSTDHRGLELSYLKGIKQAIR